MTDINNFIEYTNVKRDATIAQIRTLCKTAIINKYPKVCTNSCYTRICKEELRDTDIMIVTTAGFPNGTASGRVKTYEAIVAAEEGAKEIDYVMNIGLLKDRQAKELMNELKMVVKNTRGIAEVKVIIEASLLTEEEIIRSCEMAKEAGAAYIKTGTGFAGPATVDMVKLIRKTVGKDMKIKAAGGIKDIETARSLLAAGADFIGTSTAITE